MWIKIARSPGLPGDRDMMCVGYETEIYNVLASVCGLRNRSTKTLRLDIAYAWSRLQRLLKSQDPNKAVRVIRCDDGWRCEHVVWLLVRRLQDSSSRYIVNEIDKRIIFPSLSKDLSQSWFGAGWSWRHRSHQTVVCRCMNTERYASYKTDGDSWNRGNENTQHFSFKQVGADIHIARTSYIILIRQLATRGWRCRLSVSADSE